MLVFGDKFKHSAGLFGIPKEGAKQVVQERDRYQPVLFPESAGQALSLYLKAFRWNDRTIYILVATQPSGPNEVVCWSFPIPADIVSRKPTPLQVLGDLCTRCGVDIRIGDKTGRLIQSAVVESEPGQPVPIDIDKNAPPGFGFVQSKYDRERRLYLVALAFVLDVQALRGELTP
jgi:hypothetical protein